jgi:tRNA dimethylallyltransferase
VRHAAVLLMGPTGAGKSDVALQLAERLPLEIVSVDSAMVFRGMDIGTAKPAPEVLAAVPHHLVDLLDPAERYSAGRFVADAERVMADIHRRGRVPLLVGGTMLYFRALLSGLAELPPADPDVRRRLDERAAAEGWPALHAELARLDPAAAARIQPGDRQRIQRALEVICLTGEPISARQREDLRGAEAPRGLSLVLSPGPREVLAARIETRFHRMMELGLLDEVRSLHSRGDLDETLPSIRAVGYRQIWEHLEGRCPLAAAVDRAIVATRQLAKRQLTWLRSEPGAEWLDALDSRVSDRMSERIRRWLDQSGGVGQGL